MGLLPGARLGPYEILAPLGAGGMGEVYRAKDTKLDRLVAVKVLPEHLAASHDALSRFEREAKVVAALSHPNILGIFDFGRDGETSYAAMELLEGGSLREKLAAGPLPVRRAVELGAQIARGLAAAHDKGIVHRDLKPENLFVTPDGSAKILDFGLAKKRTPVSAEANTESQTTPGTVLGTVGYMSPEQVAGRPADPRSDVFSFGTILHEMLSGAAPFRRATSAETMTAILREEPPDLADPRIPPGLVRIVRHCLEKDPERRFRSAADIAFDLESLSHVSGPSGPAVPRPRSRPWLRPAALLAAGLGLGLLLGAWLQSASRRPEPTFTRLTFARGTVFGARFAADGKTVVYGAAWNGGPVRVYQTLAEAPGESAVSLPDANLLAVSRDGRLAIQTVSEKRGDYMFGTLAEAPVSGGTPRPLIENVAYADWAPDGASLAVIRRVEGRFFLEYPPGNRLYENDKWLSDARISPDGEQVAFVNHTDQLGDGGDVVVVNKAGDRRTLSAGWDQAKGLAWAPGGREVWFSATRRGAGRSLYAVSLSGAVRIVLPSAGPLLLLDIAPSGAVLLTQDDWRTHLVALAPGESEERELPSLDNPIVTDIAEDGRTVLFTENGDGGGPDMTVFLGRVDGSPMMRLGRGMAGGLSPDARWAAAVERGQARIVLYPTGAGEPQWVPCQGMSWCASPRFLPDGRRLVFRGAEPGHGPRLWVIETSGGKPQPLTPEGVGLGHLPISHDGRFVSIPSPDGRLTLFPIDGGTPRPVPGTDSRDIAARWASDGRLIVRRFRELPCRVFLVDPATGKRTPWKQLMPHDPSGVIDIYGMRFAADARAYAYYYQRILSTLHVVSGLR